MPSGSLYYRIFGNEVNYISLKDRLMSKMGAYSMRNVLRALAQDNTVERAKSNVFLESVVSMPTVAGFPLLLKIEGISSTYLKASGKADLTRLLSGKVDINGRVAPSGAVLVVGTMAIDGFFSKTGIRLIANAHTSKAVTGTLAVDLAQREFELQIAPGKDRQELLNFATSVHYFHHDGQKKHVKEMVKPSAQLKVASSKCTNPAWKKTFGFSLCLKTKYYKGAPNTPSFPLNGHSHLQLLLTKTDTHSAYKMSAKIKNANGKVNIRFDMNTPGSRVPRQFLFQLKAQKAATESTLSATIKTPWRQALLTGKVAKNGGMKNAELSLLVDEVRRYAIKGKLVSNTVTSSTMMKRSIKGNFKITLPNRTEQPKLTFSRMIDVNMANGNIKVKGDFSLKGMKVGGVMRSCGMELEASRGSIGPRKVSKVDFKSYTQSNKFEITVSQTNTMGPRPSFTSRVVSNLQRNLNTPQARSMELTVMSRILKTGPADYSIVASQRVIKKKNNVLVEGRHPLDMQLDGNVQLRPKTWKRITGQAKLKYTSPLNSGLSTIEFSDVILGWHDNTFRKKGAAQTKITWRSKAAVMKSVHHILYERRKNWKYLDFSVLNEIKDGGRKDLIKVFHEVDKSEERGLSVKQQIAVKVTGRIEASYTNKISKEASSSSYKQTLGFLYKRGSSNYDLKVKNLYSSTDDGVHKVTSTGTVSNTIPLFKAEVAVTPNLAQGADFIVKGKGKFQDSKFSFAHKHNYRYIRGQVRSYKLEQSLDLGDTRKIGIESEAKFVTAPRIAYKMGVIVKPDRSSSNKFGFEVEGGSVAEAHHTFGSNQEVSVYMGANRIKETRKMRVQSSAKQLKVKYTYERSERIKELGNIMNYPFKLESELEFDSRHHNKYRFELQNKLKGTIKGIGVLKSVLPKVGWSGWSLKGINYESKYNVEYAPGNTRKLSIKAMSKAGTWRFYEGEYKSTLVRVPNRSISMTSELKFKSSYEAVPKVECKASVSVDRRNMKATVSSYTKVNDMKVFSVDSSHKVNPMWSTMGFQNEINGSYFGNRLRVVMKSTKTTANKIKRVGLYSFKLTKANGQTVKGEFKSKYTFGRRYYDYISAEWNAKSDSRSFPKIDLKLLHQQVRTSNGVPAEFKGVVTLVYNDRTPTKMTYRTRHEVSAKQILATVDLKTVNSFVLDLDYEFRQNFEFVRKGYPRRLVVELLGKVATKKANLNLNYMRTQNKIVAKLVTMSNINRQINGVADLNTKYGAGFKTFKSKFNVKWHNQPIWDESLEWDVVSLQKVNKIEYSVKTKFETIRQMKYVYKHDFMGTSRLVKLTGNRNGQNRLKLLFDLPASNAPKSVIVNLQPGSGPSPTLPHVLFSWKRTGSLVTKVKGDMSFEVKPFFSRITSTVQMLSIDPTTGAFQTFKGMTKAHRGLSVMITSPSNSFKKMNLVFVTSMGPTTPKVKVLLDIAPFMTGAQKLLFEGQYQLTRSKVTFDTTGTVLGRSVALKYNRKITNPKPLTMTADLELKYKSKVVAKFNFNMKSVADMTLTGKAPWLPSHVRNSPLKMFTWNFKHKAKSAMNSETKFSIIDPSNAPYTLKIKTSLPSYKQLGITIEVKTPINSLKSLTINLKHRHTNPLKMWNDMTDKITFKYKNAAKTYSGEWNMGMKASMTKSFGVKQMYVKFSTGMKLPFTVRREMNLAVEFKGNANKAKLVTSLKSRSARTYGFKWEHDVPSWKAYQQQAKILTQLTLPGKPVSDFNIIRSATEYSIKATVPLKTFKRFIINFNKVNGELLLDVEGKFGGAQFKTDVAKYYTQAGSVFTSTYVSLKVPNIDLIKVKLTKQASRFYTVNYSRGAITLTANIKYDYDFNNKRKIMAEVDFTSTMRAFPQGKLKFVHERDLQWRKVTHSSEVVFNRMRLVKLEGSVKRNPNAKTLNISLKKKGRFFDGSFVYTRNWMTKKAKLTVSVDKIRNIPRRYAVIFDVDAKWFLKEFNMKVDIPSRLFVLRKKSEVNRVAKKWTCEFELALNQRKGQRLLVNFMKSTKIANQRDYNLDIKLPTRTLRHKLSHFKDGPGFMGWRNLKTKYSFSWDDANPDRKMSFDLQVLRNPGTLLNGKLTAKSFSFLKPLVIKVKGKKHSAQKRTLDISISAGEAESCKLSLMRERPLKGNKDVVITVTFLGKRNNVPMIQFKAVSDAKRLPQRQLLLGFQLTATAPPAILAAPLTFKWIGLYQPWRRLVLSSTTGASLDFNYKPQPFGSKLTMFLSNSRKEAARLTFTRNVRKPNLNIQLDRGRGSMVMKMPFVAPYYTPNEARVKVNIGLSDSNTMSVLALIGPQDLAKSVSGWTKQTHNLAFFFMGAKLTPENVIKFATKYRLNNNPKGLSTGTVLEKSTNAVYNLRTYLIAKVTSDPVIKEVRKVIRSTIKCTFSVATNNLEMSRITSNVQQVVVADYDKFVRYLEKFLNKNELYSSVVLAGFRTLKRTTDIGIGMISQRASVLAGSLRAAISGASERARQRRVYFASMMNAMWTKIQNYASNPAQINYFFTMQRRCINRILNAVQVLVDRLQALRTAGRQVGSQLAGRIQAYVFEVLGRYPGVVAKVRQISAALKAYSSDTRGMVMQFVQTNMIGPLVSQAEFGQLMAQMARIRTLVRQLYSGIKSYQLMDMLPKNTRFVNFVKNRRQAMKHLMAGNVKKAYQTFMKVNLNELTKFELICPLASNAACRSAKWHAAIEGQFYMPTYVPSLRFYGSSMVTMVRSRVTTMVRKMRYQSSKMYKYATSKLLDTVTRMKQIRRMKGAMPPFEASAYIFGGQRFITFDGRHFDYAGTCSHVLTHDFAKHRFTVKATYAKTPGNPSYTRWSSVAVRADKHTLEILADGQVKVDGVAKDLPFMVAGTKLMAMRMGDRVTVDRMQDRAFSVTCFVSQQMCRVTLGRWQFNKVGGMLGTFDNEPYNDLMLPSRQQVPDNQVANFARSWAVGQCSESGSATRTNPVVPSKCASLFNNARSQFARCYDLVATASMMSACANEYMQDKSVCKSAALYVEQCRAAGIFLQMPASCTSCKIPNKGVLMAGKSLKVTSVPRAKQSRDIIFVLEASRCVQKSLPSIEMLSMLLEGRQTKFGLVLYGGPGRHNQPHQHTVGKSRFQCSGANFRKSLTQAKSLFSAASSGDDSIAQGIRALRHAAYNYPSRYGAGKSIVLVSCSSSVLGINEFAMTGRYLKERGVAVHVVTASGEFSRPRNDVTVYGVSKTRVFTARDKSKAGRKGATLGRTDLRNVIKSPKDLSTTLALRTDGGAVWDLKKLDPSVAKSERRSMLSVMANVLGKTASPADCVRCRCRSASDNLNSKLDCKLCQQERGFNFWLGNNFDSP